MQQKVIVASDGKVSIRPQPSSNEVKELSLLCFGLKMDPTAEVKELNSYDDRNYIVQGKLDTRGDEAFDEKYGHHSKFILKIFNASFTYKSDWYEGINATICSCYEECLQHQFKLPLPVVGLHSNTMMVTYEVPLGQGAEIQGSTLSLSELASTSEVLCCRDGLYYGQHMVRLCVFIPGEIQDVKAMNTEQAFEYGKAAAVLDTALANVPSPLCDTQEKFIWNLVNVMNYGFAEKYVKSLKDASRKQLVEGVLESFKTETLPKLKQTTKQWVHGDLNEQNLLFTGKNLVGLLDFDDMFYSHRVVDLGTSLMYVTNVVTEPSEIEKALLLAQHLFRGYTSVVEISDEELDCVFNVMLVRYVLSCCISTYQYEYVDPGNEYLLTSSRIGWGSMKNLVMLGEEKFIEKLKGN